LKAEDLCLGNSNIGAELSLSSVSHPRKSSIKINVQKSSPGIDEILYAFPTIPASELNHAF